MSHLQTSAPRAVRRRGLDLLAAAAAAALALASCATRAAAPGPAETAAVGFTFGPVGFTAVDIDSAGVSFELGIVNEGGRAIVPGSIRYTAVAGDSRLEGGLDLGPAAIAPGERTTVRLGFDLDAPAGDSPLVPVRIDAALRYSTPGGLPGTAEASVEGSFPRIMPPVLVITSIRILKDELINTRLGVELELSNPNAFPLAFSALDYRLYGEGRYWASGSLARSFTVPATGTSTASLYLTMNFTDMGRSLLDQVIQLAVVDYRLVGTGRVATGLEFLPEFALPFDLSGRVGVGR